MWFTVCVVIVTLLGRGSATVAESDKDSSGYCRILVNDDDKVEIVFRLKLGSDSNYNLFALSNSDYNADPKKLTTVACDTQYNAATKVYSVVSRIDRFDASQSENTCGATSLSSSTTAWSYQLVFFHQTGGEFRSDFVETKDRVYVLDCTYQNSADNFITADIRSELPGSNNVPISNPIPTLTVLKEEGNSGQYVPVVNNERILRGTKLKLSLAYTYGTFDQSRYYGVSGLLTQVSSNPSFNGNLVVTFFDENGCSVDFRAPGRAFYRVDNGSTQVAGSRTYEQQTGPFALWAWEGVTTPFVYIRVFFRLCHGSSGFDEDPICIDPCAYFTSAFRRRRDIENELNSTVVKINIYDPSEEEGYNGQEAQSNEGLMIGVIVACVTVCVLLCLFLVGIIWFMKRKSSSQKTEKYPQHGFDNKAQMQY